MKKTLIVIGSIGIALILLGGTFSAGLVTGQYLFPRTVEVFSALPEEAAVPTETNPPPQVEEDAEPEITETPTEPPPDHPTPEVPPIAVTAPSDELEELFIPFWEAWDIVHRYYVEQPVDDEAMMQAALEGMLASFDDPYTSYLDPFEYHQVTSRLSSYEGIGAWVDTSGDYLTIVSPMAGSPAEEAGLLPGDEVIAVDGDDMTGIEGELVIERVLGPADSLVILTIRREGVPNLFDVEVTRAQITIPNVEYHMMDNDIGYIQIFQFGTDAQIELQNALENLLAQDPVGLVIDLRNNGGGYLRAAVEVSSEFLPPDQVVVYERYGDGTQEVFESLGDGQATDIPLVVLVNQGSASASEIVVGALQDYGRAYLVGMTTFGKGLVQYQIPLSDENGAVSVTIAHWLTPNERLIHGIGLEPDYPLAAIPQVAIDEGFDIETLELEEDQIVILSDEDIQNGVDPQLDKAIEVLMDMLSE